MNDETIAPNVNLGLVRTDLANERTLLAYGRTALIVSGTGVSLIEFIGKSPLILGLGWVLIVVGIVLALLGAIRFTRLHHRLHPKHQAT